MCNTIRLPPGPVQGREPLPPASAPRATRGAPRGRLLAMARGGSSSLLGAEQAMRIQIPDRGCAFSGTARRPPLPDLPLMQHQTLMPCGDDDPLAAHVNHRVMAGGAAAHGSRRGMVFCPTARMRWGRSSRRSCAASGWRCQWAWP